VLCLACAGVYAQVIAMPTETHERIAENLEKIPPDISRDMRATLTLIPELRQLVAGALIRALGATKTYWDKEADRWTHVPDFLAQTKAAALLVAYSDGLPMQSTVNLNVEAGAKGFSMADALANSPALRDYMRAELAKVEAKALPA